MKGLQLATEGEGNIQIGSSKAGFNRAEQSHSALPAGHQSRAGDEAALCLQELQAKKHELEQQNAAFYKAINETERLLQKQRDLFDLSPVGSVLIGRDGIISMVNPVGAGILGYDCSELVGLPLKQVIPAAGSAVFKEFILELVTMKRKARCEIEFEKDGNRSFFSFEGICSKSGDEILITMIDIVERRVPKKCSPPLTGDARMLLRELSIELASSKKKRTEELFRHKNRENTLNNTLKQQRKLAAYLMDVREEERTKVAREIHDELGQMLASLQLNLSMITMEYKDHGQLIRKTKEMEQVIRSSIKTVQRISSELRPVMLDQLGLADAMEWQAQEFRNKSGIPCKTIILLENKKVDRNLSTAVFRIFQEALTNISRHSGAGSVRMDLVEKKGWLNLLVRDDGRGITEVEKKDIQSLGIAGMRERAKMLGGKLKICGLPHQGTVVFARLPLELKENPNDHENTRSR